MNRIADRGLRIADSETQMDASLQPAVNGSSPLIRAATSRDSQSAIRNSQSVELHIEELVLSGFEPAHRYAIGDAVERELTRLFGEQGSPIAVTEDVEITHVNGGAINLKPGSNAEVTGMELARAIYGGLIK